MNLEEDVIGAVSEAICGLLGTLSRVSGSRVTRRGNRDSDVTVVTWIFPRSCMSISVND